MSNRSRKKVFKFSDDNGDIVIKIKAETAQIATNIKNNNIKNPHYYHQLNP